MEFIPLLEETKLILPVGKWVFETAARMCQKWRARVPNFCMSVNMSYEQVRDTSFRDFVPACLGKLGLPADAMILELTESKIVADWAYVNEQFDGYRAQGIRIAMDDFGTGYSSLSSLKNLSCDIVKIDREFVKNILDNDFDKQLVASVVALCHSIGIKTCIEGVEDEPVHDLLRDLCGADTIQGYLFGRPEPSNLFEDKFLEHYQEEPYAERENY